MILGDIILETYYLSKLGHSNKPYNLWACLGLLINIIGRGHKADRLHKQPCIHIADHWFFPR